MALKGPEGLADEVKAYFDANYAAKFAALNTEYGDSTVLVAMAATYIGERSRATIPEYPAAVILVSDERSNRVHQDFIDATATLTVLLFVNDTDEEQLERRVYRTSRAIKELLIEGQVSNDITWRHLGYDVDFSPAFTRKGSFLKDVLVSWSFKKREDK